MGYQPMTLVDRAGHVRAEADEKLRWKLVWEFFEEYRWEHLLAQHDVAPPEWTEPRILRRPWFPSELPILRADALVRAPAAFRKHGVYLSAHDLASA